MPKRFLTQAENFAFIGMEIKESLNPEVLIRAQAQFIAWGLQSYMAYMQVWHATLLDCTMSFATVGLLGFSCAGIDNKNSAGVCISAH